MFVYYSDILDELMVSYTPPSQMHAFPPVDLKSPWVAMWFYVGEL